MVLRWLRNDKADDLVMLQLMYEVCGCALVTIMKNARIGRTLAGKVANQYYDQLALCSVPGCHWGDGGQGKQIEGIWSSLAGWGSGGSVTYKRRVTWRCNLCCVI